MGINTIPLSRLETDPRGTLNDCTDSGETFVIELPDHRLIAMQVLETAEDDSLTSDLLESNQAFQALVAKSKASPRTLFPADSGT